MMSSEKRLFSRFSWLGVMALLIAALLAACGDATNTPAPATSGAGPTASVTTMAASTAAMMTTAAMTTNSAMTTMAPTTAAMTTMAPTTAAMTTASGTTAAMTTAAMTGSTVTEPAVNTSISGSVRVAIAPSSPQEGTIVDQQLTNFAKVYPNVKVTKEVIASDYTTKVKTELAGNDPPDVFYVDSLPAPDYIADQTLEPLNDYISQLKIDTSAYYPNLVKAFTGADGKIYGLPKDHNPLVMFYNKKMFADAGITKPPTTWQELMDAGNKLKSVVPSGASPIVLDPAIERALAFVYQAGGSVLSPDLKSSMATDPKFKKGLDFYHQLQASGIAKKSSEVGADWPGDALVKGKAAIVFEGGWAIPPLDASAQKDNYGIAELPKGDQAGTLDFTVAYVMSAKSKAKPAAFALLSYLTSAPAQQLLTSQGLALPSIKSLTDSFVQQFPARKPLVDSTNYASPWQFGVGFGTFSDDVNPSMQALYSGNKTEDQVISDIDSSVKKDLASQ